MTTRPALNCGSPDHVGDRLIRTRSGAFERRIDFRAVSNQRHVRVRQTYIVCGACMDREAPDLRFDPNQRSIFGS